MHLHFVHFPSFHCGAASRYVVLESKSVWKWASISMQQAFLLCTVHKNAQYSTNSTFSAFLRIPQRLTPHIMARNG